MKNDKEKFKTGLKKRIYHWTLNLISFIDRSPKDGSTQIIARQLLRSGTSVGANYIEAQAASSRKDFGNFLHHSLKSANESKFWLCILKDSKRATPEETEELLKELIEIANIFGSSLLTLKGRKNF
jgi:four helix bundle protein